MFVWFISIATRRTLVKELRKNFERRWKNFDVLLFYVLVVWIIFNVFFPLYYMMLSFRKTTLNVTKLIIMKSNYYYHLLQTRIWWLWYFVTYHTRYISYLVPLYNFFFWYGSLCKNHTWQWHMNHAMGNVRNFLPFPTVRHVPSPLRCEPLSSQLLIYIMLRFCTSIRIQMIIILGPNIVLIFGRSLSPNIGTNLCPNFKSQNLDFFLPKNSPVPTNECDRVSMLEMYFVSL